MSGSPQNTGQAAAPRASAPDVETITAVLEHAARRDPDGLFYVKDDAGVALTFADVEVEASRAAGQLASLGLGRGNRLVVWLPNGPLWIALLFACARLGVVLVTAGPRLRLADMPYLLRHSRARALLMASYKRPRYVRVLDDMPLTHVGKTARGELAAEARRILPNLAWEGKR